MKSKSNIFIYSIIMISTILLFQSFFEFIIKDKQGNRIFKSQIMVKCNQVENIEINLDCERFLNFIGEEVFTRLVYEGKNKIERERVGFAKVFTLTTLNQNINNKVTNEINDYIDLEAKSYFNYVKKSNVYSLIKEKNLMFLNYGGKEKVSSDRASAIDFLEKRFEYELKTIEQIDADSLYSIVLTDKSSYQRNKFGRLNNINMFIISIIFGLFLIILYSLGLDIVSKKDD